MSVRGLLAARLLACGVAVGAGAADKRPVPVYTNEDLERVSPLRAQTGVQSVPARSEPAEAALSSTPAPGRGEEYWRREARRLRDRLDPLRRKSDELRARIAERRGMPGVRPYTDPQIEAGERRLRSLEQRIRELESELEDRARRERALPGWLR